MISRCLNGVVDHLQWQMAILMESKYAKGIAGPCEEDGVAIIIEQLLELPA